MDFDCDKIEVVTDFPPRGFGRRCMEVPSGFIDPAPPNLVCKLQEALYYLRQVII